jgi:hypothetical protein
MSEAGTLIAPAMKMFSPAKVYEKILDILANKTNQ